MNMPGSLINETLGMWSIIRCKLFGNRRYPEQSMAYRWTPQQIGEIVRGKISTKYSPLLCHYLEDREN